MFLSPDGTALFVVYNHHKSGERGATCQPIGPLRWPAQLDEMLRLLLNGGYRLLYDGCDADEGPDRRLLYLDKHGRPFTSAAFTVYWEALMIKLGEPPPPIRLESFLHSALCIGLLVFSIASKRRKIVPAPQIVPVVCGEFINSGLGCGAQVLCILTERFRVHFCPPNQPPLSP